MAERALATAFVNIVPGTKDLELWMKKGLPDTADQSGTESGKRFGSGLGAGIKSMMGPIAAAFSIYAVADFTKNMFNAAQEGMRVDATLTQVTKSMGLFGAESDKVVGRLQDYATEMMKRTGIDDDVIKSTQAQLMSFKELAASADTTGGMFDRATSVAADMAAVFGGDAAGNAVKLGKALNDPVNGISALSRVGVQFTDDQKAMIEGMVKAGDVAGAQELIMKELETQVGGTAEASATSADKMKARWDDAVQNLGTQLMPVFESIVGWISTSLLPAFEGLGDQVSGAFQWFTDNQGWLLPLLGGIGTLLLGIATSIGIMNLAAVIAAAGGLPAIISATWLWTAALLANPITWVVLGIAALVAGLIALAMNWEAVAKWVSDVWAGFTGWLSDSFNSIAQWWNDLWTGIGKAINDIWTGISNWFTGAVTNLVNFIRDYWGLVLSFFIGPLGIVIQWVVNHWGEIVDFFRTSLEKIGGFFQSVFQGVGDFVGGIFDGIVRGIKGAMNMVIDVVNGAIDGVNFIADRIREVTGGQVDIQLQHIPKLAKGGFVDRPTTALIGEAGPEVVTPLKDFERMMGLSNGGNGQIINYYAAPNQSLDAEQALFTALERAKVRAAW